MNQRALFLAHAAQTSPTPLMLEIAKAEGIYMYDTDGKSYIDMISGIGVSNIGHRHPKVLEAIRSQSEQYLHLMVYGEYIQSPQNLLAKKLSDTLPHPIDNVYFVNSGSEAIEGALKLAKRYTGRSQLISCYNAYHGSSHGALSLGSDDYFTRKFRPLLPGISHIRFAQEEDLSKITEETAAVVIETVQGEAGIRVADRSYFEALRRRCDDTGALLILDEVQAGFGRTGKFWAFEHYSIVPDVVVSAKGMGGGMPIGAFMSSKEIMSSLMDNPILGHITTFGGHPVSCAASLATMEVLLEMDLIDQVATKAQRLDELLVHPLIQDKRQKGLMMAVAFESYDILKPIIDIAIDKGVVTDWFLFCDDSMRIAPPLTITLEEIDQACNIILDAIQSVHKA